MYASGYLHEDCTSNPLLSRQRAQPWRDTYMSGRQKVQLLAKGSEAASAKSKGELQMTKLIFPPLICCQENT